MLANAFYIISDSYFTDFNDPYLRGNKKENRPHYFAYEDKKTGLYWMIPMSSKALKYKTIMQNAIAKKGRCDFLHISILDGKHESVFMIGDMFPVTQKYILRNYTANNVPLVLTKTSDIKIINSKVKRVLAALHKGITFTPTAPDVLKIEQELLKQNAA